MIVISIICRHAMFSFQLIISTDDKKYKKIFQIIQRTFEL